MKLIFYKAQLKDRLSLTTDSGFSLLETAIALITLGICLAYAMPLFLYAKINNSKSDIQTGALIVAQRVFDNVRSQPITALPTNDGITSDPDPLNTCNITCPSGSLPGTGSTTWKTGTNVSAKNPVLQPADMTPANITAQEKLITYAMGRQYRTKVTYCQNNTVANPVCGAKYRQFQVQVSYNGTNVYDLQGTYTEFD